MTLDKFQKTGSDPQSRDTAVPKALHTPEPEYTEAARKLMFQGTGTIRILVDAQGHVTDARLVKLIGLGLDESTVKTWTFSPAIYEGKPVAVTFFVEMAFHLYR